MATTHITHLWACHAPDCLLCQGKDGEISVVQQGFWHCQEVEIDGTVLLIVVGMLPTMAYSLCLGHDSGLT